MSQPALNGADITIINSAEATTDWEQTGQMGPSSEPDFFVEGTQSVGIEIKSTGATEFRYDRSSGSTIVGMHIKFWLFLASSVILDTFAGVTAPGLTVRVWDSGGSNWGEWDIGGSDVGVWIGKGFKLINIDGDRAFDRDSGTAPAKTDIQYIGISAEIVSTLAKTTGIAIDQLMISASADSSDSTGGVLEITSPSHTGSSDLDFNDNGGSPDTIVRPSGSWITDGFENGDTIVVSSTSSNNIDMVVTAITASTLDVATGTITDEQNTSGVVTAVVTLQDIVTQDQVTDDTWYGHIQKDKNGSIELTGKIVFGDISGALNTIIRDTNQVMIWADNAVGGDQYKMIITEDTGTTEVQFGTEVGTGDDSRGTAGGFMTKLEDVFTFDYSIKAIDASPVFNVFGMTINGATGGIRLEQTDVQFVSTTISNSGQITLSTGAEMREGIIAASTEVAGIGAILLNANPTDPEFRDMSLINNVHAIESETNGPTTLDARNWTFAGNTADLVFNHTSGVLTYNVLEGGDSPSTSDGGGGGTVVINNAVTIGISGLTEGSSGKIIANETVGTVTIGDVLMEEFADSTGFASTTLNYEGAFGSGLDVLTVARNQGLCVAAIAEDTPAFVDETAEAASVTTNDMTILPAVPVVNDAYYFAHTEQFIQFKINITTVLTQSSAPTFAFEYWNGAWVALSGLSDGTNGYETSGENIISFTLPGDWATTSVNSQGPFYYVRIRLTVVGTITQIPIAQTATIDATRFLPYDEEREVTSSGLTDIAAWTEDTISNFTP